MQSALLPLRKRTPDRNNVITIGFVHLMAGVAVYRLAFFHHFFVEWLLLGAFFVLLYAVSLLGVTLCYHRWLVLTHKSFRVPSRWFRRALLAAAALSAQGSVRYWVPDHIVHHMYEDQAGRDPHSPDEFLPMGENGERDDAAVAALPMLRQFRLMLKGCFWAHMGWLLWKHNPFVAAEVGRQRERLFDAEKPGGHGPEVVADLNWQCRWIWPLVIFPGFALPMLIGGVVLGALYGPEAGLWGAFDMLLVAGFLRLVVALHATWSVNSMGHIFGTPAKHEPCGCVWEKSHARNCAPLMLVTMGEWGHGNHHYDGSWAYFSPHWDPGKWFLIIFERLGWVESVNRIRKSRRCRIHG